MRRDAEGAGTRRHGNYRTAAILAIFAAGLFAFTLYTGLK